MTTNTLPASGAQTPATATLHLGPAHLTVTDLDRSLEFYERALGLRVRTRDAVTATLTAGGDADLLVLAADPSARPAGRHAGLYHVALLHPSRLELARAAARLAETRTRIYGASDHGISEAIYLPDPDGNGIELAADRPRAAWPEGWDGRPEPLDLHALLGLVVGEEPRRHADPGLVVGHLHLHVGDIERGLAFYRDVVGFEVQTMMPSAAFVSAGGYHHHLGFNTWRGTNVPPAPAGTVGLREWTVVLPEDGLAELLARLDAAGVARDGGLTADPWGNAVRFVSAP